MAVAMRDFTDCRGISKSVIMYKVGRDMKRNLIIVLAVVLLVGLCGCSTMDFDRNQLKASGMTVNPKLPALELKKAETVQLGSNNAVSESTYIYTILRREVEKNICDMSTEVKGEIEMELIYLNVEQNPGWSSKNRVDMEFEITIRDLDGNKVWTEVYSDSGDYPDDGLMWTFRYSTSSANNALTQLMHEMMEDVKSDIQTDAEVIIRKLQ